MNARLLPALILIATIGSASGASRDQVMFSKYLKYQFCMERRNGQGVYARLGLATIMNRWGVMEPTAQSIANASAAVKQSDTTCRAENEIADEPRPN